MYMKVHGSTLKYQKSKKNNVILFVYYKMSFCPYRTLSQSVHTGRSVLPSVWYTVFFLPYGTRCPSLRMVHGVLLSVWNTVPFFSIGKTVSCCLLLTLFSSVYMGHSVLLSAWEPAFFSTYGITCLYVGMGLGVLLSI